METTAFPIPPPDGAGVVAHVDYLIRMIRAATKIEVSDLTTTRLRGYFARVGEGNYEDLTAWIFLECWHEYKSRGVLTDEMVALAADRVRQRLSREAKKFRDGPAAENNAVIELPPDEGVELIQEEFHTFLRTRDTRDALLFQKRYLDGKTVQEIATELGLPISTIYRRLKAIRDDFLALREAKTRPTASD